MPAGTPRQSLTLSQGGVTVASAAVATQIGASPCGQVIVQSASANTGVVCVGGSGVLAAAASRTGIALAPGGTLTLDCDSLGQVWVDSTVSGDKVHFVYIK